MLAVLLLLLSFALLFLLLLFLLVVFEMLCMLTAHPGHLSFLQVTS